MLITTHAVTHVENDVGRCVMTGHVETQVAPKRTHVTFPRQRHVLNNIVRVLGTVLWKVPSCTEHARFLIYELVKCSQNLQPQWL